MKTNYIVIAAQFAVLLSCASSPALPATVLSETRPPDRDPRLSISLGGNTYHIPRNYIGYAMTEQQSETGHAGVSMFATLPNLDVEQFSSDPRGNKNEIFISVRSSAQNVAVEELAAWKAGNRVAYVGTAPPHLDPEGNTVTRGDKATATDKYRVWDMYEYVNGHDSGASGAVIFCGEITEFTPVSRCRDAFVYKNMLIQLTYDHSYLKGWSDIRSGVARKLDSWSVNEPSRQ